MRVTVPITVREAAHALYVSGKAVCKIATELDVRADTISQWAKRYGWQVQRQTVDNTVNSVVMQRVTDLLSDESQKTRKLMSEVVTVHAETLAQGRRPTLAALRSTPARQGLAAVAKTVVETAAALYGWNADKSGGLVLMESAREIEARVVEQPATPTPSDTTTGSVQAEMPVINVPIESASV
jgi:hypothetical protein